MIQYKRIGEILLEKGVISRKQLEKAVKLKSTSKLRFGQILVMIGAATEEDVVECLADQLEYPVVNLDSVTPSLEALKALDRDLAVSHLILPVRIDDTSLDCIVGDPIDICVTDVLTKQLSRKLNIALAPPTKLIQAIEKAYAQMACQEGFPEVDHQTRRKTKVNQQWDRDAIIALAATIPHQTQKQTFLNKFFPQTGERS